MRSACTATINMISTSSEPVRAGELSMRYISYLSPQIVSVVLSVFALIVTPLLGQLSQDESKLVATGSLSSDGNTAVVGGPFANTAAPLPIITLSQADLRFNGLAGGPNPDDRAFRISNSGPAGSTLNFTISAN